MNATKTPAEKLAAAKRERARENRHPVRKFSKVPCLCRETRVRLGLSINEVAKATGISLAGLSAIERGGDVQMTTCHKLCRFFGMTVGDLWPVPKL